MEKHKRIFSRIYTIFNLYNEYINNEFIDIREIFLNSFQINKFDEKFSKDILLNYIKNKEYIQNLRIKYQNRHAGSVDMLLSIIVDTAVSEFLFNKLDYKIIISEYVKITWILHQSGKGFVNGILNSIFKDLSI